MVKTSWFTLQSALWRNLILTVVWFFFFLKGLLLIFIYTSHLLSKCIFTDSLKIGDYVIFSDTVGCFLSVEGILLEELVAVDTITSLHDSVFCVHLQRQYSAARELNAFLEKYGMDVKNITDDSELKYLQALEVRSYYFVYMQPAAESEQSFFPYFREEPRTKISSMTTT